MDVRAEQPQSKIDTDYPLWKGWFNLVGGFLLQFLVGVLFITGNIAPYFASYFRVEQTATVNVLPSGIFLQALLMPIGSWAAQRYQCYPRVQLTLSIITGCIILHLSTYTTDFGAFWILYILGMAIISAGTYMVTLHHGWMWFAGRKPALATGMMCAGFPMAAVVLDPVTTMLINPWNYNSEND